MLTNLGHDLFPVPILGITSSTASVNPTLYGALDTSKAPANVEWLLFINCTTAPLTCSADGTSVVLNPNAIGCYIGTATHLSFGSGSGGAGSAGEGASGGTSGGTTTCTLPATFPFDFNEDVDAIPDYSLVPDWGARQKLYKVRYAMNKNAMLIPQLNKPSLRLTSASTVVANPELTSNQQYVSPTSYTPSSMVFFQISAQSGSLDLTGAGLINSTTQNTGGGSTMRVVVLQNCSGSTLYVWGLNSSYTLMPNRIMWYIGLSRMLSYSTTQDFTYYKQPLTPQQIVNYYSLQQYAALPLLAEQLYVMWQVTDLANPPGLPNVWKDTITDANLAASPRYAPYVLSKSEPAAGVAITLASSIVPRTGPNAPSNPYSGLALAGLPPPTVSNSVWAPQRNVQVTNSIHSAAAPAQGVVPILRITGPTDAPFGLFDPTMSATPWRVSLGFPDTPVPRIDDGLNAGYVWLLFMNCSGRDLRYAVDSGDSSVLLSLPRNTFGLYVGPSTTAQGAAVGIQFSTV
jgi:hypothetical protein